MINYFQVIAPWDQPWRSSAPSHPGADTDLSAILQTLILVGFLVVGILFARWNLRQGRGDGKGAVRLTAFIGVLNCIFGLSNSHFVPRPDYILMQMVGLGVPLLIAFAIGVGYVAVEPYARRSWPRAMVSWQRLLRGRGGDPLVGRDIVFGVLAGAIVTSIVVAGNTITGIAEASTVSWGFGQGAWASMGFILYSLAWAPISALVSLAVLTIATRIFGRKWIGILIAGLVLVALNASPSTVEVVLSVVFASVFMTVLLRFGLIASASLSVVFDTLTSSPPLNFSAWYSGRAAIALLVPIALLVYGFWISLGGQSPFGNALTEEKMP